MQKLSLYLYPNRVQLIADVVSFPVEWRIVYQRPVKFYQGMDNVIEFDVKNAQQRRIKLQDFISSGDSIRCVIMDQLSQEIYTADVFPIQNTTGLASMTIPASVFSYIKPQFLKYSVYIVDELGNKTPMYADAQFGMSNTIELIGGVLPTAPDPQLIDTFYHSTDDDSTGLYNKYISEGVEVNPRNDINKNSAIAIEFILNQLDAEVTVEFTDYSVISSATKWYAAETFMVEASTSVLHKTYNEVQDYSNNIGWMRIRYTNIGNPSGTIDKILVRV